MFLLAAFSTAFAGKEERDYAKNDLTPAIKDAETKWKSACGCMLAITVDASVKVIDDMKTASHFCAYISAGVGGYCTDAGSRKALCQMKTLTVAKADVSKFTFKAGKGLATVYDNHSPSFEMIAQELDK
jgi:opacity protein-like surface antigen